MTQDEFDRHEWRRGIRVIYGRGTYDVVTCNFRERLLGLSHPELDLVIWARCENVELVESGK